MTVKLAPLPSGVTGALRDWALSVERVVNSTPSLSYFSGSTPESVVTALPGHIAVNVASGSSDVRVYVKGGDPASGPSTTGWTGLTPGTVAAGFVTSVSGTADRITIGGTAVAPVVDIASTYAGQSTITTVGTLSSGAVPASLVTAGTFGAGIYTFPSTVVHGGAAAGIVRTITTPDTAASSRTFYERLSVVANTGSARNNIVLGLGYNLGDENGPQNTSEPAIGWITESYYFPLAGNAQGEVYVQYIAPASVGSFARRPFAANIRHSNGFTETHVSGDTISFYEGDLTGSVTTGLVWTASGNTLSVAAATTFTATIASTVAGASFAQTVTADTTSNQQISVNSGGQAVTWGVYASGTNSGAGFVGTTSAENFVILTSDTIRATFAAASGNVTWTGGFTGITTLAGTGAVSGFTTLSVSDTISTTKAGQAFLANASSDTLTYMQIAANSAAQNLLLGVYASGTNSGAGFIGTTVNKSFIVITNDVVRSTWDTAGKLLHAGELEIDGALNHDGTTVGFYGVTPTTRQVLATGAGATVDNVITALQTLGLVSQS